MARAVSYYLCTQLLLQDGLNLIQNPCVFLKLKTESETPTKQLMIPPEAYTQTWGPHFLPKSQGGKPQKRV